MKTLYAFVLVFMFLMVGCTTVPPEPENGPPEPEPVPGPSEPEPAPGPAPEPEPDEGRVMGYPPSNGDLCSSRAAHKYAEPQGYTNALCYDAANFARYCQSKVYSDEGQCAEANGGRH